MDTGFFIFPFLRANYRYGVQRVCNRNYLSESCFTDWFSPVAAQQDPDQAAINDPRPRSDMVRGRLRFDASRKDRSMPDKKIEFYEVFSAPTAFDTFLLYSVLDCASQRPEDAPETANTQNKKELTMDFKKLYFTLFNTLSDAVEQIDTHDYEEARLLLIHAQQEAEECYITSA